MGVFNFSDINWVDIDAVGKEGKEFVKWINDILFSDTACAFTTKRKNILDLVMTTEPDIVENIKIQS